MTDKMLITQSDINPLEIFLNGKHTDIIERIKAKSLIAEPDVKTGKGRELIRSMSAKVASSKVFLVKCGKDLSDKKRSEIEIDLNKIISTKNEIQDTLDKVKIEVRKPLTDWENEKKEREAKEALEAQKLENHEEALELNKIETEKRELAAEREKLRLEEQERKKEDELRKKIEKEKEDEKFAAMQREATLKADKERLKQKVIDDEKQAKIDQENAVLNAEMKLKHEAERKEKERIESERVKKETADKIAAEEKRIKDEKAADIDHRKKINNEALSDLLTSEIDEVTAKRIIVAIIEGKIRNISINY